MKTKIKVLEPKPYDPTKFWAWFSANNTQHLKVLSLLKTGGFVIWNDKLQDHHADLGYLDNFLKSDKSPVKKPLNEQTVEELHKTIYALEKIVEYKLSK